MGTCHYLGELFSWKGRNYRYNFFEYVRNYGYFVRNMKNHGHYSGKIGQELPRIAKDAQKLFDDFIAF